MKKLYVAIIAVGTLLLIGGVLATGHYFRGNRDEKLHFTRNETELIITDLANAPVRLFKSGKSLPDATEVKDFNGTRAWLPRGSYFLKVDLAGLPAFYPIPIAGYRRGPDANGSFAVTIRSLTHDTPPRLLPNLPEWVFIPSGNFLIGDRQNPREPHYVWLPAFFISAFEVTNAEFREFAYDVQGYANDANWTDAGKIWKAENQSQATSQLKESDTEFERFGQNDQPVTWVNWYEAQAFCKWATKRAGSGRWLFSLPSEAEWEKVARGPDGLDYALSSQVSDEEMKLYNWKKNPTAPETVIGIEATRDRFKPNRYGAYHLSGNVFEWMQTTNRPYNRDRPYTDDDGRNREEGTDVRVTRGGSWYSASVAQLSIAYRETFPPEVRHHDLGFRIVAHLLP